MARPADSNPMRAKLVKTIDSKQDRICKKAALVATTSTALATVIGSALLDSDVGVTLVHDGTVQYNPAGAADGNSGFIPSPYTILGDKGFLDTVRLYAAGTPAVSVIVHTSPTN